MISSKQYLHALMKECYTCKHLFAKLPEDAADFRPTPGQRSTLELLRYISVCATASMHVMLNGSDWKLWKPYTERTSTMNFEDFPAAMDRQIEEIEAQYATIQEEDFFTKIVKHPSGEEMQLGEGLIRMPLSWLVAYRMQLFLYAKQCGANELKTADNWGVAVPVKN